MNTTGQSEKEKRFYEKIKAKNEARKRLPRGMYVESEMMKG